MRCLRYFHFLRPFFGVYKPLNPLPFGFSKIPWAKVRIEALGGIVARQRVQLAVEWVTGGWHFFVFAFGLFLDFLVHVGCFWGECVFFFVFLFVLCVSFALSLWPLAWRWGFLCSKSNGPLASQTAKDLFGQPN